LATYAALNEHGEELFQFTTLEELAEEISPLLASGELVS